MHDQVFLLSRQADFVIADAGVRTVGRIANAVLIAQLFLNLGIDLLDGFLLRNFKEAPAGFPRKLLQDFFAVRMILLRKPAPATVPAEGRQILWN